VEIEAAAMAMEIADATSLAGRSEQFAADFRFHEAVARAAQMPRLLTSLRVLWVQTQALLHQLNAVGVYPGPAELAAVRADHRAMFRALVASEPVAAADAAAAHIEACGRTIVAAIREHCGVGGRRGPTGHGARALAAVPSDVEPNSRRPGSRRP
jgi:DNA-binding GntR family transcriptional regulator